jgi:hypothetical protein
MDVFTKELRRQFYHICSMLIFAAFFLLMLARIVAAILTVVEFQENTDVKIRIILE